GLMQVKEPGKQALLVLTKKAKDDPDVTVRQSALRTLGRMGKDAAPAVLEGLKDREPAVQVLALRTLPAVKVEAKTAVPAVEALATKSDVAQVRSAAVNALGKLRDPAAEGAIVRLLAR